MCAARAVGVQQAALEILCRQGRKEGEDSSAIDKAADKIKNLDFSANDLGLAVGQLCLRATELGLGTCIIGWLQAKKIAKELPLSVGEKVKLIVAIGHPADEARPKKRKSADEKIVFEE